MLIRMLPDQVAACWEDVKYAIEESLPPTVGEQGDKMNKILESIMMEKMIVWTSVEQKEDRNVITGIVVTTFTMDACSGTNALLMYCLYGYSNATRESWESGLTTLQKFAKANGCHRILAYTDVPSLIKFTKSIGGEAKYVLCSLPL